MAILGRLREYLDSNKVTYQVLGHQEAYTAPEVAHVLHIPGKELAKVVMVKAGERFVMVVLPSNWQIDLKRLAEILGTRDARLASEEEFKGLFPDCEVGAMPPFGNLYGLEVYVDRLLTEDEEIVFQDGSHLGAIKLRYQDFADLVHPTVAEFHRTPAKLAS
ncbi:aminoacyl-tRNA deacylase [Candidatus Nitrospira bockiana]